MVELIISEINPIITKEYLEKQPEGQYFERKESSGSFPLKASKLADELIGMLNADGGILALGVTDKGDITGLNQLTSKQLDIYRTIMVKYIKPCCNIELEEVFVDEKLVFLYHVEQEVERTFSRSDKDFIFLRVLDTNRILNRDEVKKLEYDKSIRRFEEEVVSDFDLNDLDTELLSEYKNNINYSGSKLELLCKRYLAKKSESKYLFYNSSILLFAKEPEKYIPSASVRYIRYDGIDARAGSDFNVIKDERFENNIPNLISELKTFLRASFKDYYFLDIDSGIFKKVPEYPEEAWLEGIVNALCHRSYNVQGNVIYIKHFDDRVEISNSGPLPSQVTVENIKTERFARNPRIARVLGDMGYVRELNEGVSRIYESMEKSMLSVPEYKQENGNVYLTLSNKIKNHAQTFKESIMVRISSNWNDYNSTQQHLLEYLFFQNKATMDELSNHLEVSTSTVREYIRGFIRDAIIVKVSEKKRDKNAAYMFNND